MLKVTDTQILQYAKQKAGNAGKVLTPSMGAVFIALVHMFEREAMYDIVKKAYVLDYTHTDFANQLQFSKRLIDAYFRDFQKFGLLKCDKIYVPIRSALTYIDLEEIERQGGQYES